MDDVREVYLESSKIDGKENITQELLDRYNKAVNEIQHLIDGVDNTMSSVENI